MSAERKRTKALYASEADHRRLRIEAAECECEIGEITDHMIRLWFKRPKRERQAEMRGEEPDG